MYTLTLHNVRVYSCACDNRCIWTVHFNTCFHFLSGTQKDRTALKRSGPIKEEGAGFYIQSPFRCLFTYQRNITSTWHKNYQMVIKVKIPVFHGRPFEIRPYTPINVLVGLKSADKISQMMEAMQGWVIFTQLVCRPRQPGSRFNLDGAVSRSSFGQGPHSQGPCPFFYPTILDGSVKS